MFAQSVYVFSAGDLVLRAVNIDVRACYLWKQMFSKKKNVFQRLVITCTDSRCKEN